MLLNVQWYTIDIYYPRFEYSELASMILYYWKTMFSKKTLFQPMIYTYCICVIVLSNKLQSVLRNFDSDGGWLARVRQRRSALTRWLLKPIFHIFAPTLCWLSTRQPQYCTFSGDARCVFCIWWKNATARRDNFLSNWKLTSKSNNHRRTSSSQKAWSCHISCSSIHRHCECCYHYIGKWSTATFALLMLK